MESIPARDQEYNQTTLLKLRLLEHRPRPRPELRPQRRDRRGRHAPQIPLHHQRAADRERVGATIISVRLARRFYGFEGHR